jgi:hypothetical protein
VLVTRAGGRRLPGGQAASSGGRGRGAPVAARVEPTSAQARRRRRVTDSGCARLAQLERLMARDGSVQADAQARIGAQMPLAEKALLADISIDNNSDVAQLEARVGCRAARLVGWSDAAGRWSWIRSEGVAPFIAACRRGAPEQADPARGRA